MRIWPFIPSLLLLASLSAAPAFCHAQNRAMPRPPLPSQTAPEDPDQAKRERELAKRANEQRQEQLKRDTENLYKLATELKQYVDKSNQNTLSVDVIRKAEEIERLAHSIRDKMKGN